MCNFQMLNYQGVVLWNQEIASCKLVSIVNIDDEFTPKMCPSFSATMIFHRFSLGSLVGVLESVLLCCVSFGMILPFMSIQAFFHGH